MYTKEYRICTRKKNIAMITGALTVVFSVFIIIMGFHTFELYGLFGLLLLPIPIVFCIFSVKRHNKAYRRIQELIEMHKQLVKDEFKMHNFDYFYYPGGILEGSNPYNIEEEEFNSISFIVKTEGNSYVTNDLLLGSCDNVEFRSVSNGCHFVDYSGKKPRVVTLFSGRTYTFDLRAEKEFMLVVKEESYTYAENSLEEIEFESIEANKKFNFFTNDKHLAFYYVKPNIVENLLKMESFFDGSLFVSIANGNLYVGKNGVAGSFELTSSTTRQSLQKEIEEEIEFIKLIRNSINFDHAKKNDKN